MLSAAETIPRASFFCVTENRRVPTGTTIVMSLQSGKNLLSVHNNYFTTLDELVGRCGEAVEVWCGLVNGCLAQPPSVVEGFLGDRGMVVHVGCRLAIEIRSRCTRSRGKTAPVVERRRDGLARLKFRNVTLEPAVDTKRI